MKLSIGTRRKIYYTAVVIALVAILASAVVINRTLINTPEFDIESIAEDAGEPVAAYMAYIGEEGDVVIGIADSEDEHTEEIIGFVKNMQLGSESGDASTSAGKAVNAWVALYDSEDRIASRMNFYDDGATVWYDGGKYSVDPSNMYRLIEYCNAHREEPEATPTVTPTSEPEEK